MVPRRSQSIHQRSKGAGDRRAVVYLGCRDPRDDARNAAYSEETFERLFLMLNEPSRRALLTGDYWVTYPRTIMDDDRVFKALGDPTRRLLLDRLFERDGRTLTDLESRLEMKRFCVMKHL